LAELASAIAWENNQAHFGHVFGIEAKGFSDCAVYLVPGAGDHDAG
jgi:hypothetical protein